MYPSTALALFRAFNVTESFYQTSPLERLCKIPDWDNASVPIPMAMTAHERIEQDSQTHRMLKQSLPNPDFNLLKIIYCRDMCVDDWRTSLDALTAGIRLRSGRIRFNRNLYEYTCISHLTHQKIKDLRFSHSTVRKNKSRVCLILDALSLDAHRRARVVFLDNEMVYF